jgi:hypothetical protein
LGNVSAAGKEASCHSSSASAKDKNGEALLPRPSTPLYVLVALCLIKEVLVMTTA